MTTIDEIETWLGSTLPESYRGWLIDHDEDLAASDLVLLYGRESFIERNETCETKAYCPGYVTIGNDGGDRELILSLADERLSLVDVGSMSPADADFLTADLQEWINGGCLLPADDDPTGYPPTDGVCVFLETEPASLKTLLLIKQHLGLQNSTAEIKAATRKVPCLITDHLTYAQAMKRCEAVNQVDNCLSIRSAHDNTVRLPMA